MLGVPELQREAIMRDKDHQDLDQEEEAIQEREDADLHQNLQDQGLQERGGLEAMREGWDSR